MTSEILIHGADHLLTMDDERRELAGADAREMLAFETLTFVPIDRRLIDGAMLSPGECIWINAYHAEVMDKIGDRVTGTTLEWLKAATAPL